MDWLVQIQTIIHHAISDDLGQFASNRDWMKLAAVMPLGILFGAVHALTPGHGKSLLASYVLGSRLAFFKAAMVAALLAMTHVGMGVILALASAPLITRTLAGVGRAPAIEQVSGILLIAIGAWLFARSRKPDGLHRHTGPLVGIFAGLVPCPLTLFVMMFALSRGVPEAGVTFAAAMMLGVMATLVLVAILTVLARDRVMMLVDRYGASVARFSSLLDGLSGLLIMAFGVSQIMR